MERRCQATGHPVFVWLGFPLVMPYHTNHRHALSASSFFRATARHRIRVSNAYSPLFHRAGQASLGLVPTGVCCLNEYFTDGCVDRSAPTAELAGPSVPCGRQLPTSTHTGGPAFARGLRERRTAAQSVRTMASKIAFPTSVARNTTLSLPCERAAMTCMMPRRLCHMMNKHACL